MIPGLREAQARYDAMEHPSFYTKTEYCDRCCLELEDCENGCDGACQRCSVCGQAGECKYSDCGIDLGCSDCPEGGHTREGDCLYTERAVARAEDLAIEQAIEDAREDREAGQ